MSRRVSSDTECTSACFTCHPSLKQRAFLEWQIFAYLWDCKEFSQTEKPDLSSNKTWAFVVEKCLKVQKYSNSLELSYLSLFQLFLSVEMQKERGTGGQGAGESRRQEAGTNKEAEGRRWVAQNFILPKCWEWSFPTHTFTRAESAINLKVRKVPSPLMTNGLVLLPIFFSYPRPSLWQCVAMCGKLCVCMRAARLSRDEGMPLSPGVRSQVAPWIIIMSTQQQIYLSIVGLSSFWYFLFKIGQSSVPSLPVLHARPGFFLVLVLL